MNLADLALVLTALASLVAAVGVAVRRSGGGAAEPLVPIRSDVEPADDQHAVGGGLERLAEARADASTG